jgi:hypothetical protein
LSAPRLDRPARGSRLPRPFAARASATSLGALLAGVLALGRGAQAQPSAARVLLVGAAEHDPTVLRLRRELSLIGAEVETVPGEVDRADPAALSRARRAAAVVVVESPRAARVWSGGAEVRIDEASGDGRLLALRAVEILRERLFPDPSVAAPSPQPVPSPGAPPPRAEPAKAASPTAVVPAAPPPAPRRFGAFVGPALAVSPGGLSATPHVFLGGRYAVADRLEIELVALLPTTAATLSANEGTVDVRAGAVAAGIGARLTPPSSPFFLTAAAGAGALISAYAGEARAPYRSASGARASLLPEAHLAAGYRLTAALALRGDVLGGFALPQPIVTVAGRRAASFGAPTLGFALALEVTP